LDATKSKQHQGSLARKNIIVDENFCEEEKEVIRRKIY
jgi:hypothetical protein